MFQSRGMSGGFGEYAEPEVGEGGRKGEKELKMEGRRDY